MCAFENLTICSVVFNNKLLLDFNWQLTQAFNDENDFTFLVINNHPQGSEECARENGRKWQVVPGIAFDPSIKKQPGSFHHASGLAQALPHVKTRFALFMDPDFFIVRKDWTREVVAYMQSHDLTFFGAPWNPKWFSKYRYFPCPHCLFVDLDRVKIEDLDFRPEGIGKEAMAELKGRKSIGLDHDTGYRIFKKYSQDSKFRNEYVTPVFKPAEAFRKGKCYIGKIRNVEFLASPLNQFIEKFLPDDLCFIPRKRDYFTETSFSDLGFFDASTKGWEEYLWQGEPFAFHLRNAPKMSFEGMNLREQLPLLEGALDFFSQGVFAKV